MVINYLRNLSRKVYYFKYYNKFRGIAKNVILSRKGFILNPGEITFGENIFIGRGFHISAKSLVFGSNIMIGPNVLIECSNHTYDTVGENMFSYANSKSSVGIKIEDDVWIGGNVAILDGVTIGEGCVIGASSLINKSLPPYTICVGIPCKPIKKRFDDEILTKHLSLVNSNYNINEVAKLRNPFFQK
jgi:acetyltransferase-like isoleucine patch superfamily enzyme